MSACLVYPCLGDAQLTALWRELLDQPGLPQRFELDRYGDLVETNPPKTPHQRIVHALQRQIVAVLGAAAGHLSANAVARDLARRPTHCREPVIREQIGLPPVP